ncbi:MAG: hypothetical protein NPIRA03_25660 [Nitrospirales bacterium]|nr:MAG: hypothetical protein NPIRA03_25660 [Nitrospirales bacterium]
MTTLEIPNLSAPSFDGPLFPSSILDDSHSLKTPSDKTSSGNSYVIKGVKLFCSQDYEGAVEQFKKVPKNYKWESWELVAFSASLFEVGEKKQAFKVIRRIPSEQKVYTLALLDQGRILYRLKTPLKAYEGFQENQIDLNMAFFFEGAALVELGEYHEAIFKLQQVPEEHEWKKAAWFYEGLAWKCLHKHQKAIDVLDKVKIGDRFGFDAACHQGYARLHKDQHHQALSLFQMVPVVHHMSNWALLGEAFAFFCMGSPNQAIESLKRLTQGYTMGGEGIYRTACLMTQLKEFQWANDVLEKIPPDDEYWGSAVLKRGEILNLTGKHEEAIDEYEKIPEGHKLFIKALDGQGAALTVRQKWQEGFDKYQQIPSGHKNSDSLFLEAVCCFNLRKCSKALKNCNKIINDPESSPKSKNLATELVKFTKEFLQKEKNSGIPKEPYENKIHEEPMSEENATAVLEPVHPGKIIRKELVEGQGLKVKDIAEKLGITRVYLSFILNGTRDVSGDVAIQLSEQYGLYSSKEWRDFQKKYNDWKETQQKFPVSPQLG